MNLMKSTHRTLALLGLLGLMATPSLASAQTAQAAAAEGLFQQGMKALQEKRYDEACAMLRQSDSLDPANGTKLNLARCEEERGKLSIAWSLYKSTLAKLPPTDKRISAIQERIAALEPRIPSLTVKLAPGAPKDTRVVDGELDLTPLLGFPVTTDPGKHTLVITAPGHESHTLTVEVAERTAARPGPEVVEVEPGPATPSVAVVTTPAAVPVAVAPTPPPPAPVPATAPPAPVPPPAPIAAKPAPTPVATSTAPAPRPAPVASKPPSPSSAPSPRAPAPVRSEPEKPSRTPGFVVGGLGAVFLGVGATSYMMTLGKVDEAEKGCPGGLCTQEGYDAFQSAQTLNIVSLSSLALGAVGVGTGVWLIVGSAPKASSQGSTYTAPGLVAGSPGWTLGGSW